jgi:hypothetical protein
VTGAEAYIDTNNGVLMLGKTRITLLLITNRNRNP